MRRGSTKTFIATALVFISTFSIASAQRRNASRISLSRSQTREAEQRLAEMGYWTGPIDGINDPETQSALIAFQKWEGRALTGKLNIEELAAIKGAEPPKPRDDGYGHIEVDLDRQVLMIINDDGKLRVLPVSSGSGETFMDEDEPSISYTPRGRFVVYDKITGWEFGPLGAMYYPNYISGGIAIHGSRNVPPQPESHGCIRIPLFAAREVSKLTPLGTIVLVYDKVSFVSGRPWANDPRLKKAASIE